MPWRVAFCEKMKKEVNGLRYASPVPPDVRSEIPGSARTRKPAYREPDHAFAEQTGHAIVDLNSQASADCARATASASVRQLMAPSRSCCSERICDLIRSSSGDAYQCASHSFLLSNRRNRKPGSLEGFGDRTRWKNAPFLASGLSSGFEPLSRDYLIAWGLIGEPAPPGRCSGGAVKKNS